MQNWLFRRTNPFERWLLLVAGLMLVYPKALFDWIGLALFAVAAGSQLLRGRVALQGA